MTSAAMAELSLEASSMRLDELQRAVEWLLVGNLNLRSDGIAGAAGHSRLVREFFTVLERIGAPTLFCDVGANDGSTGMHAKRIFPTARVLSLEANPHIQRVHAERLGKAGVESLNIAACSSTAAVTIYIPRTLSRAYVNGEIVSAVVHEPSETGKSSLLRRDEEAVYEEVRVPGSRLDDLLRGTLAEMDGRRAALWIDVEGAALDVLLGSPELLERTSALLIETENFQFWTGQKNSGEVARLLIAKGFLPVSRDHEYSDKQFNTLFVHGSFIDALLPELYAPVAVPAAPESALRTPVKKVRSLRASMAADVPIFVPTFNNPTFTRMMVEQLRVWNLRDITLVDSGSTYGPMVRLLETLESTLKVVWLEENAGPHFLFTDAQSYACLPELFCVTDPDLLFRPEMPQDFLLTLMDQTHVHQTGKAGLALTLDDRAAFKQHSYRIAGGEYRIWEWESRFWTAGAGNTQEGDPVFKADIDTTFALYNKRYFTPGRFYEAVRIAGKYACRHLPWYRQSFLPSDEQAAYRQTQKYSYYGA